MDNFFGCNFIGLGVCQEYCLELIFELELAKGLHWNSAAVVQHGLFFPRLNRGSAVGFPESRNA